MEFEAIRDTPITQMRAELGRILARTDMWDGDTGILQVLDATGGKIKIGELLSGRTSAELTDLGSTAVREELVKWLNPPDAAAPILPLMNLITTTAQTSRMILTVKKLLVAGAGHLDC